MCIIVSPNPAICKLFMQFYFVWKNFKNISNTIHYAVYTKFDDDFI